jgi:MSHA biogenesis protein MshM
MYLSYFNCQYWPFSLTPNTNQYFGATCHNEAIITLNHALLSGEGFIKVVGEVGTGKTLLCRKLLNELPASVHTAYIPNPHLAPNELRHAVANELGVNLALNSDQQEFTQAIQTRLVALHQAFDHVVLVIDEAQALPVESMEALRLITNFETETHKLLQVVLLGQPELDEKIALPELRQLKQRITFSCQLSELDAEQIYYYVRHRMVKAGYQGPEIFSRDVCRMIKQATQGTPRIINVLSHKILMLMYGKGLKMATPELVKLAALDTEACHKVSLPWRLNAKAQWRAACLVTVGLCGALLLFPLA